MPRPAAGPSLLAAALLLAAPALAATSATTTLIEVHNARRLVQVKNWLEDATNASRAMPPSLQALLLRMPDPKAGIAWLWLLDRGKTQDFEFDVRFASQSWAIGAKPLRPDSRLSMFLQSGPQALLQGGDIGRQMGNNGLPPLDLHKLESTLDRSVDGPRDIEALLGALTVADAQRVLFVRTGQYACSLEELEAARASGGPLLPAKLVRDNDRFGLELQGKKDAAGKCTGWTLRAINPLEGFPSYELTEDRRLWVLPTWGEKKGQRILFDQYKTLQ